MLNLIFLNQLYKNKILLYNDLIIITLIREKNIIVYTKQKQNLFIIKFDITKSAMRIKNLNFKKIMAITGYG